MSINSLTLSFIYQRTNLSIFVQIQSYFDLTAFDITYATSKRINVQRVSLLFIRVAVCVGWRIAVKVIGLLPSLPSTHYSLLIYVNMRSIGNHCSRSRSVRVLSGRTCKQLQVAQVHSTVNRTCTSHLSNCFAVYHKHMYCHISILSNIACYELL